MERWDVVVVGAGPAGATAALAARQADPGARVLLLDRDAFPRDKVCGDGVAPHVFDELHALGVGDELVDDHPPVPRLELLGPRGAVASGTTARPARVVPRRLFDARLVHAAVAAGAVLRRHRVRDVRRVGDRVEVDGVAAARVVVGADGVTGPVRRNLGLPGNPPGHLAVAVRGYVAAPGAPTEVLRQRIVLDPQGWPGYAWWFPTGTGVANVGYGVLLRDGRAHPTRAVLTARLRRLVPDLDQVDDLRGALLPLASWRPRQPDGPVLLVGDAASLVNPMTGEGIYDAVASGALAGRLSVDPRARRDPGGVGAAYRTAWRRRAGSHERSVRLLAAIGKNPRVVDAGVAAAGRDPAVLHSLVELGLAHGSLTPRLVGRTAQALVHA